MFLNIKNLSKFFAIVALGISVLGISTLALPVQAKPYIRTEYGYSLEGMARVRVINESNRLLACYVGLDGRKMKFRLPRNSTSKWYKATDKRFNYTSFTTWCDYIENHPEYL